MLGGEMLGGKWSEEKCLVEKVLGGKLVGEKCLEKKCLVEKERKKLGFALCKTCAQTTPRP